MNQISLLPLQERWWSSGRCGVVLSNTQEQEGLGGFWDGDSSSWHWHGTGTDGHRGGPAQTITCSQTPFFPH